MNALVEIGEMVAMRAALRAERAKAENVDRFDELSVAIEKFAEQIADALEGLALTGS